MGQWPSARPARAGSPGAADPPARPGPPAGSRSAPGPPHSPAPGCAGTAGSAGNTAAVLRADRARRAPAAGCWRGCPTPGRRPRRLGRHARRARSPSIQAAADRVASCRPARATSAPPYRLAHPGSAPPHRQHTAVRQMQQAHAAQKKRRHGEHQGKVMDSRPCRLAAAAKRPSWRTRATKALSVASHSASPGLLA